MSPPNRFAHPSSRWILLLAACCLNLLLSCSVLAYLRLNRSSSLDARFLGLSDPEIRREALLAVMGEIEQGQINDSHPDRDVQRILLPGLKNTHVGRTLETNRQGLRERNYRVPKPAQLLRVVFLGDSFVYGWGVEAQDRVGVHLEKLLRDRGGFRAVECLHFGVASWNVGNECAYLRRQLGLLDPDLVVQVIVSNDFGDSRGVRGNGLMAAYDAEHGDGILRIAHPTALGFTGTSMVHLGLDELSARRMSESGAKLAQLRDAVVAQGGRYVLMAHVTSCKDPVLRYIAPRLDERELLFFPNDFVNDRALHNSETDTHWSAAGHEQVAKLTYGICREWELFGSRSLPAWEDAEEMARNFVRQGHKEARNQDPSKRLAETRSWVDFSDLDRRGACQVSGGVFKDGLVAPYAAMGLLREGHGTLRLVGERLGRPELRGGYLTVLAEGNPVGRIELHSPESTSFDVSFDLAVPSEFPVLGVELVSTDYCYPGAPYRQCVSLRLHRIELN